MVQGPLKRQAISIAAAIAGLGLGALLVSRFGFHRVLEAALSVGWFGFGVLLAWQLLLFGLLGVAWWLLLPRGPRTSLLVWARMVRDSTANCLPFSALGGFVLGARAAMQGGLSWPMATGSTLADVTVEYCSELVFALAGLGLLIAVKPSSDLIIPFGLGIAAATSGAVIFIVLQCGAGSLARRLGSRIRSSWLGAATESIELTHKEIALIYARLPRCLAAGAAHFVGWVMNGVGGWLIMHFTGSSIGLPEALAIEGLLQVALTAAFAVPGFAGVQEGAYVLLGSAFGLSPEAAIAVSLVRRARDLTLGIPILFAWQMLEARHFQGGRSRTAASN